MKLKVALVQFARRESFKENIKRMQEILSDVKDVEIVCLYPKHGLERLSY